MQRQRQRPQLRQMAVRCLLCQYASLASICSKRRYSGSSSSIRDTTAVRCLYRNRQTASLVRQLYFQRMLCDSSLSRWWYLLCQIYRSRVYFIRLARDPCWLFQGPSALLPTTHCRTSTSSEAGDFLFFVPGFRFRSCSTFPVGRWIHS